MLPWLSHDGKRLLAARVVRSFAYGFLAVALGSYLKDLACGGYGRRTNSTCSRFRSKEKALPMPSACITTKLVQSV